MGLDLDKLKNELQTSKGLLSEIKKEKMPNKVAMAKIALKLLEERNGKLTPEAVRNNFDDILTNLIITEYGAYRRYEKELIIDSLRIFLRDKFEKTDDFPELQKFFSGMKKKYLRQRDNNFEDFIGDTITDIYPILNIISFSASQAAKSRAGGSLENHLENLFNLLGFKFKTQQHIKGARVDFIFPDLKVYEEQPTNCIFLASQTTLKDRFRLSLSKISSVSNARKYIVTATGKGLITKNDYKDLTKNKVGEIREKGFKLIVFSEVKERFKDNPTVVSFSDFIKKEYPSISRLWD